MNVTKTPPDTVRKVIAAQQLRIPTLCPAVAQLMTLPTSDPDYFDSVLAIVVKDPGLTAELVRMARSAIFGSQPPPSDSNLALVRVGAKRFVSLLFSTSLSSLFAPPRGPVSRYWRHSLLVACLARRLAAKLRLPQVEMEWAFSLGILHNVGGLVLAANDTAGFTGLLARHDVDSPELRAAEEAAYGQDHCAVGERVCVAWKLPESARVVVLGHHGAPVSADPACANYLMTIRHALALAALVDPSAAEDAVVAEPEPALDPAKLPRIAPLAPDDLQRILVAARLENLEICRQFGLASDRS